MKPIYRTILDDLNEWISNSPYVLNRIVRDLHNEDKILPSEFADVGAAIASCQASIQTLTEKVDALFESDEELIRQAPHQPLTETEIDQLLALNRYLKEVTGHLYSVAEDVTPRLEAKLADPNDPMYDYEIEVLLNYALREDDPEYDEDDDNFIVSHRESLKHLERLEDMPCDLPFFPERLWSEPHCWLFQNLRKGWSSGRAQRISHRDCLRIDRVWIDVQVWQQYEFKTP